ncbi:hypothetical protein V5O48_017027, partial [Marasmius crinis-equi]
VVIPAFLEGTLSNSKAKRRRRKQLPPIYLFVVLFSSSTIWSLDPTGQIPISNALCHYLGLPLRLSLRALEYSWETSTYQRLRDYQIARGFDPTTTDFAQHNEYPLYHIVEQPLPDHSEEIVDYAITEHFPSTSFMNAQPDARAENIHQSDPGDTSRRVLFGDASLEGDGGIDPTPSTRKTVPLRADIEATQVLENLEVPLVGDKMNAMPPNVWSRLMSLFSFAALEDSEIHSAGF